MEQPKTSCVPDWSQWDASLMEWKKDRAPSFHESEFPTPLYVFGYGSLIWRPALLEQYPSYHATAVGYRRLFAQRSCDHRGTCKFPGLVLNLVTDDYLASKGYFAGPNDLKSYDCHGLVWLIPEDRVSETLEYLDHRERGGYDRHFLPVVVKERTPFHEPHSIVNALAYVGHETNPNFYLPPLYSTTNDFNRTTQNIFNLQGRSVVTDIISAAKGCSGTNVEYILRLQHYLHERNMADDYINNLARAVIFVAVVVLFILLLTFC
jgi:cation transport protein ChaC